MSPSLAKIHRKTKPSFVGHFSLSRVVGKGTGGVKFEFPSELEEDAGSLTGGGSRTLLKQTYDHLPDCLPWGIVPQGVPRVCFVPKEHLGSLQTGTDFKHSVPLQGAADSLRRLTTISSAARAC